jgi:hypothetical protein
LKFWLLFWQDRTFYRTDLEADTTVDAGRKIDPIPTCALSIFAWSHIDAGNRAGVYAVGNAFADIGDDGMRHGESLESLS